VLIYPALATLFAALLVTTLAPHSPANALFSTRPLRFLGTYSYGLYVFHGLLEPVFAPWRSPDVLPALSPAGRSLVAIALWAAASLALALLSKRLLEDPFLRLKRYC
jgi:peptidoglycan/LPS O-acetylase OafA/YrhL